MALLISKPTSPGKRGEIRVVHHHIHKGKPHAALTEKLSKSGGRNNQGRITVRHIGGGSRNQYRMIDFKRDKDRIEARVERIEYDPNRSARIALIRYHDGDKRYILAAEGMKTGDQVLSSREKIDIKIGNRMPLQYIPAGITVHNVELNPGRGGVMARSAGAGVIIQAAEGDYVQLKLASGEIRLVKKDCSASIGQVSNIDHMLVRVGKAGRKRHMGWRPTVRGKAMNPCDHPHGGGEGRHSIGMPYPKTLWGKHALGVKTRNRKKWSNKMILSGRKKRNRK